MRESGSPTSACGRGGMMVMHDEGLGDVLPFSVGALTAARYRHRKNGRKAWAFRPSTQTACASRLVLQPCRLLRRAPSHERLVLIEGSYTVV
jgi:hypothetical protein